MSSSPSFAELVRDAVDSVIKEHVDRALTEQQELLAPLQRCGELLTRRAALSIRETAEVLGVSEATVCTWIKDGELVPLDFGGDRRLIGTDQIIDKLAAASSRRRNCGEGPK